MSEKDIRGAVIVRNLLLICVFTSPGLPVVPLVETRLRGNVR